MTKSYIAGFFDGEGCVSVYKNGSKHNSYYLTVQITQNRTKQSTKLLTSLKKIYGGSLAIMETTAGNLTYKWQVGSKNAVQFLKDISPYVILKKNQVDLAMNWQSQRPKIIRNRKGQIQTTRPENLKYTKWVSEELKRLKREFV